VGFVNNCDVFPYSINIPARSWSARKNPAISDTRAACCMLWVTNYDRILRNQVPHQILFECRSRVQCAAGFIQQYYLRYARRWLARCTIAAAVRPKVTRRIDAVYLLLRPRARPDADCVQRLLPIPSAGSRTASSFKPAATLSRPTSSEWRPVSGIPCRFLRRITTGSASLAYYIFTVQHDTPFCSSPWETSCIRFRQRINVDFPQPEGPIIAMIALDRILMLMFLIANVFPYQALRFCNFQDTLVSPELPNPGLFWLSSFTKF